ncbi:MAG: glycosyltransferase [Prevotella sp.]|nr:glycosyltransferase [Prevotella sp.]
MHRKKILFLLYSMNVGGVEKSLLGLLSAIDLTQYDVHVALAHKQGGFFAMLPKEVTIHQIDCIANNWQALQRPPLETLRRKLFAEGVTWTLIKLALAYIYSKLNKNSYFWMEALMEHESDIEGTFDLAVAYAGPTFDIDFVTCNKVKATNKVGWIHFDISKFGIDKGMTAQLYKGYKRIFIVSEAGKEIFDKTFPQFKQKTEVFHNIVSPLQVRQLAEEGDAFTDSFEGKRILTVGRISPEKGQRVAIKALKSVRENGHNVRWYFVGDGKDMENCKADIKALGLEDCVVFLGTQTNPYSYMRDCDIYVQPSRHEGFCITLAEALCFGSPVVATDFTGAREQLRSRENGFVVGMEASDIAQGIIRALNAPRADVNTSAIRNTASARQLLSLLD